MTKSKVEQVLENAMSLRISQIKMIKELGFDHSKETFIKGNDSIVIILELTKEFHLIILMEMNPLKVEFFECE